MQQAQTSRLLFQRRRLTRHEAAGIVEGIASEPHITGYSLREWTRSRDVFVLYDGERRQVAAALLVHHLIGRWSELAALYVVTAYRGNGLSTELMQLALQTLRFEPRTYLACYSNPWVARCIEDCGFTRIDSGASRGSRLPALSRLYLRLLYKPQWLSNLYRIKELLRKQRRFDKRFRFTMAIYRPHAREV